MSVVKSQDQVENLLLRTLSPSDFSLLAPRLTAVDLPIRKRLIEPYVPIETIWFMETGIASMVATSPEGHQSESGIIGRCGFIDIAVLLGKAISPIQCYIQVPGHGYSMPVSALREALSASPGLNKTLLSYVQAVVTQITHTALSNAAHNIEERLARWILMCFDRINGDEVQITHEFLSLMLNVRRAGVTMALASLSSAGLIATRRGVVILRDHAGLHDLASDSYGAPEEAYERMLGTRLMRSTGTNVTN